MAINPFINPNAHDYIVLSGVKSPGLSKVSGGQLKRNWDERKATGASGASLVYQGESLLSFKVTFILIKSTEWSEWENFYKLIKKEPTFKKPKALQIYHPFITDHFGVSSVVVENIGQPEETNPNELSVTVDFKQYRAPKSVAIPAKGTVMSPATVKTPDAKTGLEKEAEDAQKGFEAALGKTEPVVGPPPPPAP